MVVVEDTYSLVRVFKYRQIKVYDHFAFMGFIV